MRDGSSSRLVPARLAKWMQPFSEGFTAPTWQHVLVLIVGTILTPGRRTVAAALRVVGLEQTADFTNYHRVLNRNRWSSRWVARCLFRMLVNSFVPTGPVVIGLDDTIERRWGAKIKARGIYRDPVRSSHGHFVKASGLRWLSIMLLPEISWARHIWALPFLTVLAPSERYARKQAAAQEAHRLGAADHATGGTLASRAADRRGDRQRLRCHRTAQCGSAPHLHDHPLAS
jgi:hypothetical protein